jgi:hypothetical protein
MVKEGYLRISKLISPFTGIEFIPEDILNNAAMRGTKVHKHVEGLIQGFEDDFMDPAIQPYIDSFHKFQQEFSEDIYKAKITQEKRFYCDEMMITMAFAGSQLPVPIMEKQHTKSTTTHIRKA